MYLSLILSLGLISQRYIEIVPVIYMTGTNVFIRGTTQFRADARNFSL